MLSSLEIGQQIGPEKLLASPDFSVRLARQPGWDARVAGV
jgi:hypothetical protein